ncbi:hypothetical protein J1N35_005983 [Gossypium stocksii]|uniref:Uncharacterized protein n=1 Tax=Gossypium stocksii TaxID=47602 RepID=A0A9D4AJH7_9ROSI|nr:hypothetical protein J1N35_005983 [Gossypium stocksii]
MKSGYEQCYFCITENRIAAILLKEAAERRRLAERDGIHVFLQHPKVRGRPNSRFLAWCTVRSVIMLNVSDKMLETSNRAVEVNEMWRVRQKEMELNDRLKSRSNDHSGNSRIDVDISIPYRSRNRRHESNVSSSCSSSKAVAEGSYSREHEGLRDNEIDEFL